MRGRRFSPVFIAVLFLIFSVGAANQKQPESGVREGKDFVFVCQDAGAGGYEAFPDVCRLNDGRLMAVFYAGYGHVSLPSEPWPKGGRICYCLSSDEGRTWTKPRLLYDGPDDDRDPSIVQLRSGRLLCNFFSLRKAEGKPWQGRGTWLTASDDLGRTWSAPQLVSADYYCSSPARELPDGSLILGLYREEKGKSWGAAVISEDGGKSWGRVIDIDNGGYKLDAETDILPLKDGSVLIVYYEEGEGSNIRAKRFRATLSGVEWLSFKDSERMERKDQQRDWGEPSVRIGLVELVNHKFLDENYRRQEFSYADGTKVVIDLDKDQVDVSPRLDVRRVIR